MSAHGTPHHPLKSANLLIRYCDKVHAFLICTHRPRWFFGHHLSRTVWYVCWVAVLRNHEGGRRCTVPGQKQRGIWLINVIIKVNQRHSWRGPNMKWWSVPAMIHISSCNLFTSWWGYLGFGLHDMVIFLAFCHSSGRQMSRPVEARGWWSWSAGDAVWDSTAEQGHDTQNLGLWTPRFVFGLLLSSKLLGYRSKILGLKPKTSLSLT